MKYLIWGAGTRGGRYVRYIPDKDVIAFVDNAPSKIGTIYCGKPVISFEMYLREYTECFLIVGMLAEREPVKELERIGIWNYLLFSECPGEYQEHDYHTVLQDYIKSKIDMDSNYIIYGSNLFAIQLNEILYEHTGKYAPIMLNKNLSRKRAEAFVKTIGDSMNVHEYQNSLVLQEDCILAACEDSLEELKKIVGNSCKIINLFDCSKKIEAYHNPKIEAYKKLHKGESCFIVALGPSLRIEDLDLIYNNKIPTISMNSIWKVFSSTRWRPTYYMIQDPICYKQEKTLLQMERTGMKMMFLSDTNDEYWKNNEPKTDYLIYHLDCRNSELEHPKFSDDLSRRAYDAATITYVCIQMAVYMGFKNIYLLGVDFSGFENGGDLPHRHFYSDVIEEIVGFGNIMGMGYESARKYADTHGIHIYNSSRGGCVEVFDRVDFDSLFCDGKFTPESGIVHYRRPWYE